MKKRILLVEHNQTFSQQISSLLQKEGYAVKVVHTALDAYKYALRYPVDLILTNLQLPKVSGLHLARKIRAKKLTSSIPIFMVAKKSVMNSKLHERIKASKAEYMTLPLNRNKLLDSIKKLVDSKIAEPEEEESIVFETNEAQSEKEPDSSDVDTDKFARQQLIEKIDEKVAKKWGFDVDQDQKSTVSEASKTLAEITQQAEENLSTIISSERPPQQAPSKSTSNYLGWWGFRIRPFSNTPDNRFYFSSKQHSEAIARLTHTVENMEGLAVLIGKIGAGKTTLARRLLESFNPNEYLVALMVIIHSAITPDWLLRKIAMQLGVRETENEKLLLIGQVYKRLVEIYEEGKKAVILIDEAQMLQTRELMEEFRGLLNLEVPGKKLLTFVFFGLEELNQYLALDEPLKQRIALKYTLKPFDRPSTRAYILHRLKVSGVDTPIFSEDAVNMIYELSDGTPRLINTLCNNALLEGFFLKKRYIDQNLVRRVGENLDLTS